MVRKIGIVLSGLILVCISATALAEKPPKADVWHCGCVAEDEYTANATAHLRWKLLSVKPNATGHENHLYGDVEDCYYYDENSILQFYEKLRDWDDCEDTGANLMDLGQCDGGDDRPPSDPTAGNTCEQAPL
jgi:hypothetical protein